MVRLGDGVHTGDLVLYRAIDDQVRQGQGYYAAAARLHRAKGYPLRPFVTVRPPLLAWTYARLGPSALLALGLALNIGGALLWYRNFIPDGRAAKFTALAIASSVGAAGLEPNIVCSHEWWAGLLLSAALAFERPGEFAFRLVLATIAAAIRELAALFLVVLLVEALWQRRWGRTAAIAATIGAIGLGLVWHRLAVSSVVMPNDLASQGWFGARGPLAFFNDLATLLSFDNFPGSASAALAILPLAGWSLRASRYSNTALLWFGSFACFEALAARPDNFYWAQIALPAYAVGMSVIVSALSARVHLKMRSRIVPASPGNPRRNLGTKASPTK